MQQYVEEGYNADELESIFSTARKILAGWWAEGDWGSQWHGRMLVREWHAREQGRYELHPVVKKAMRMSRPDDWQRLLLEWPHVATTDPARLAFTKDERAGEADRQVITTIGKYLRANFSKLPDHAIRDLTATNTSATFKIVCTTAEMLYHLHNGPRSCMVWDGYNVDEIDSHPYHTYDPALGWHMAVRIMDGQTVGRALCNTDSEGQTYFVRTYKRDLDNPHGYSHADEQLVAWLKGQDYLHYSEYPDGTKLKYIERKRSNCGFLAPYLDGDTQRVNVWQDTDLTNYLVIDEDGRWDCDQTSGDASDGDGEVCEDCDDRISDGDGYWVGRHEDRLVCESCRDDRYRYAYGYRGHQYHEHEDDCIYVEDCEDYYVYDYLGDNNIVELKNGDYVHQDNAVCVDDDWYHIDDERIQYCEYDHEYHMADDCVCLEDGTYALESDAWKCYATSDWYSNDVEPVIIDGETYHPDNAPEQDEDSETADE